MFRNRQLYINGQEVYLDSDEIIPITKQVNNIAELKDRQADFTTDFKIPATRKNRSGKKTTRSRTQNRKRSNV